MQTVSTTQTMRIASVRSMPQEALPSANNQRRSHLAIPTSDGMHLLPFDEIVHCQADSNYCAVHCRDGQKIVVSRTLKAIEALLPEQLFLRVHQSHVILLSEIRLVQRDQVVLSSGSRIPLARSHKISLSDRLLEFATQV